MILGKVQMIQNKKRALLLGVSSLVMIMTIVASFFVAQAQSSHAASAGTSSVRASHDQGISRIISASGQTSFSSGSPGTDYSVQTGKEFDQSLNGQGVGSSSSNAPKADTAINRSSWRSGEGSSLNGGKSSSLLSSGQELKTSFDGLNFFQQRFANGGNQFSIEPPDQGLCAGNGFVMEAINSVLQVYDPSGTPLLNGGNAVDLNTFFGYPAQFNRHTRLIGPFVTDPSCYFDKPTQRWFVDVLTLEVNPKTGAFLGPNHLDLAVSTTSDPRGSYVIYRLPVQDDGTQGTPNHHCDGVPGHTQCLGDYPHIGADANGFYITTNEYGLFSTVLGFHGAQIYAFSKSALAANSSTVTVVQFDTAVSVNGNPGFTVWPASSPGTEYDTSNSGTEFFLSSNAAAEANGNGTSHDLIVWALTNTQALDIGGSLALSNTVQSVLPYTLPPLSKQKHGSTPQADCLNTPACATILLGAPDPFAPEHEFSLFSNDTRMQQVVFAHGLLWGALDTGLIFGVKRASIEWFTVAPSVDAGGVQAEVVGNAYLALPGANLTYPAIAVGENNSAVMAFTLVGPHNYPSAAYAELPGGLIHIAAAGVGPDDGFTGYAGQVGPIVPPEPRWGDYGAAVPDGDSIWIASEYIGQTCTFDQYQADFTCGHTRGALGNWDTRISRISISG